MNHPILLDSVGEHMPALSDPNALPLEKEVTTTKGEPVDCAGYEAWQERRGDEIRICDNDLCEGEHYEGYMYHPTGPPSIGGDVNLATWRCDSKTISFMERIPPTLAHLSTETRNTLLKCLEFREQYWIAAEAIQNPDSKPGMGGYVVCGPSHQENACDRAKEVITSRFEYSGETLKLCENHYAVMYEKMPPKTDENDTADAQENEYEDNDYFQAGDRLAIAASPFVKIEKDGLPEDPCRACMMDPAHTPNRNTTKQCETKFFWLLDNGDFDMYIQNRYDSGCNLFCLSKLNDTKENYDYRSSLIPDFLSQCLDRK